MEAGSDEPSPTRNTPTATLAAKGRKALDKTPSGAESTEAGRDVRKHKPPAAVQRAAKHGLELRKRREALQRSGEIGGSESLGGTDIGVARAIQLTSGDEVSDATVRRMAAYFTRHAKDKQADGFGDDANPSPGYVAWLLWGGDAGAEWAKDVVGRLQEAVAPTSRGRANKAKPIKSSGRAIANIYSTTDVTLSIQLNLSDLQALFSGKEVEISARDLKAAADQSNVYRVFISYTPRGSGDSL